MLNKTVHEKILEVIAEAEQNPTPNIQDGVLAFSCYMRKGLYKSDMKIYLSENITPALADVLIRNIYASVYEFSHRTDPKSKKLDKKLRRSRGEDVPDDEEEIKIDN